MFFWFFFISSVFLLSLYISLLSLSIFSFVLSMFVIAPWSIFILAALKPSSDNSYISVILVLSSVDCLLFIWLEIFLVLGMTSDFLLKHRHFCIVVRLWILVKHSLSWVLFTFVLFFTPLWQGKEWVGGRCCFITASLLPGGLHPCWQPKGDTVGEAPHAASADTVVAVASLLLHDGKSPNFSLGLFWYYFRRKALGCRVTARWKLRLPIWSPLTLQGNLIAGLEGWKC